MYSGYILNMICHEKANSYNKKHTNMISIDVFFSCSALAHKREWASRLPRLSYDEVAEYMA